MTIKGKFLPDNPPEGYQQTGSESHKPVSNSKFCGPTKGNSDLPPDRSTGLATGYGGGQHKAGGMKKKKGMSY